MNKPIQTPRTSSRRSFVKGAAGLTFSFALERRDARPRARRPMPPKAPSSTPG